MIEEEEFKDKYGINSTLLKLKLKEQGYDINKNFELIAYALGYRWLPILNVWVHLKTEFETKTDRRFFRKNVL